MGPLIFPPADELVTADQRPGEGQIRDSNKPMLLSALETVRQPRPFALALLTERFIQYGHGKWVGIDAGIARDEQNDLEHKFNEAISKADVLLTSGGVSMGELDLMQPLLERYGNS